MEREPSSGLLLDGRFRLGRRLGEGGMAEVFEALDTDAGARVAVKVLKPSCASDMALRSRFVQEAVALKAMRHPNVIQMHHAGGQTTRPYLALEFVPGLTLRALVRAGAAAPAQAARAVLAVLSALDHTHQAGIVHRDVKPCNVMVSHAPVPRVVLVDFGLAKFQRAAANDGGHDVSRQGVTVGTPGYMSPEQILGGEVDLRADLYAAGVMLYEVLTGVKPFFETGIALLRRHVVSPLPRLSIPGAPRALLSALDAVVQRATAKEPEQRYGSAAEMAGALATALEGLPQLPRHAVLLADPSMEHTVPLRLRLKAPSFWQWLSCFGSAR